MPGAPKRVTPAPRRILLGAARPTLLRQNPTEYVPMKAAQRHRSPASGRTSSINAASIRPGSSSIGRCAEFSNQTIFFCLVYPLGSDNFVDLGDDRAPWRVSVGWRWRWRRRGRRSECEEREQE